MTVRVSMMVLLLAAAVTSWAGVKTYVGLGVPSTAWGQPLNWEPSGVPASSDTVYIGFSPYVTVSGSDCRAHTVVIQTGGRLVVQEADSGNRLTVERDFIVEEGGIFNTLGDPAANGPQVYIGGNVHNAGVWDLAGAAAATKGVIFNRVGTQYIFGPNPLTFQNLANNPNDSLIVSFAHVGVMGYTIPTDWINATVTDGGTFNIGGPPLPITLASFSAVVLAEEGLVRLHWRTLSELDNYGFTVERSPAEVQTYTALGFVPSQGTGIQVREYTFDDAAVTPGRWVYRLRQIDLTGAETLSEAVTVSVPTPTSVGTEGVPSAIVLAQNYPNPFNPSTTIRFALPEASFARLDVVDVTGRVVGTLVDEQLPAGEHTVVWDAATMAAGVYYARLHAGATRRMLPMVLVR